MDPRAAKAEFRAAIQERLSRMSPGDRAAESRSVCRRILQALPKEPSNICAYYPLTDEVDIRSLLKDIPALGHTVYLPRKEGNHFVFRKMESVDTLKPDDFKIPAPADDSPLLEANEVAVVLVPGRAFNDQGYRLGRGNGGYDIWIRKQRKENPATRFLGIAFECQVVPDIPCEEHDERVDAIITARGMTSAR